MVVGEPMIQSSLLMQIVSRSTQGGSKSNRVACLRSDQMNLCPLAFFPERHNLKLQLSGVGSRASPKIGAPFSGGVSMIRLPYLGSIVGSPIQGNYHPKP